MAIFDWNKNGKDDAFDTFMDYQLYKETFGKEDEDSDLDFEDGDMDFDEYIKEDEDSDLDFEDGDVDFDEYMNENEDADFDDYMNDEDFYNYRSGSKYSHVNEDAYTGAYGTGDVSASSIDDIYGLKEIKGRSTEEILKILIARKIKMDYYLESCSVESGFREVFDNRQMGKDFWLYDFSKLLDTGNLNNEQKVKVLQLLLDIFDVDNRMSAENHYYCMNNNRSYEIYMTHCFDIKTDDCAVFWILLSAMSWDDRLEKTIAFTKEHLKFMAQLEVYLSEMFKGYGFGEKICSYLLKLTDYVSDTVNNGDLSAAQNMNYIVNPVFPNGN